MAEDSIATQQAVATPPTSTADLEALKARQRATWSYV